MKGNQKKRTEGTITQWSWLRKNILYEVPFLKKFCFVSAGKETNKKVK